MRGQTLTLGWVVLGCLFAVGLVGLFFAPSIEDSFRVPDRQQMRAYRISRLSDQQLISLHEKSVQDFEQHKQLQAEDGKKYWTERAQRQQACESNPAAKLRDPRGCYEPLPIEYEAIGKPLVGWESPEKFFEDKIMGVCPVMKSVREAKQAGCLPSSSEER
jgi:hypothetical protein